jgi:hypothetical protein
MGRLREGQDLARRALDSQRLAAPSRMATLDTLAKADVLLGELEEARECWLEAVERGLEIGWKNGVPFCLFELALVADLTGDREGALRLHFVAERLNPDLHLLYYDPSPHRKPRSLPGSRRKSDATLSSGFALRPGCWDPTHCCGPSSPPVKNRADSPCFPRCLLGHGTPTIPLEPLDAAINSTRRLQCTSGGRTSGRSAC